MSYVNELAWVTWVSPPGIFVAAMYGDNAAMHCQ